jgi:hypothetical protein
VVVCCWVALRCVGCGVVATNVPATFSVDDRPLMVSKCFKATFWASSFGRIIDDESELPLA